MTKTKTSKVSYISPNIIDLIIIILDCTLHSSFDYQAFIQILVLNSFIFQFFQTLSLNKKERVVEFGVIICVHV